MCCIEPKPALWDNIVPTKELTEEEEAALPWYLQNSITIDEIFNRHCSKSTANSLFFHITACMRPTKRFSRISRKEIRIQFPNNVKEGEASINLTQSTNLKIHLNLNAENPCLTIFLNTSQWTFEFYECLKCHRLGLYRPAEKVGLYSGINDQFHLTEKQALEDDEKETDAKIELLLYPMLSNWRDLNHIVEEELTHARIYRCKVKAI